MRVLSARESEVTSPERRGFILVLGVMSLLFLAVEGFAPGQPGYVLAARLAMSALLLTAPVLLGRRLSPGRVAWIVHGLCAGVVLAFGTIAWGTGGTESPYFAFLPMLPLVFTIAVPDLPLGSLVAGLCAGGVGLARVRVEGLRAPQAAFWVLAFTSTTIYATAGSWFARRQRARERRLVEERARAEEILAESERQRARAERLALVGRLAAGMARDVAEPLSSLAAGVGELERWIASDRRPPHLPDTVAGVRASLDLIRRTVEDLQRFAREDREASERCELAVVALEAHLALAERFGADVALAHDPNASLPPVRAVRAHLVEALVWLMVDASGRGVRRLRLAARAERAAVVIELEEEVADPASVELPADPLREAGLALALAREELSRAGCRVDGAPGCELRLPLRIHCAAAREVDRDDRAARVA